MYRWLYRTNQRWMKGSRSLTNLKSLANSCHNLSEWMYVWIPKTVLTQKEQGKTIIITTNLNQLNIIVHRQSWQLDESRTCSLTCLQQSTALPVGLTWQFLRTPLLERIAVYLIESSTMCPRHTQPPHLACCPPGVMNQQSQYYLPIQGYNLINEDNVVSNPSMIRKRNSPWLKKGCLTVAKQANPRRMAVKFSVRTIAIVALEKYKLEYSH